LTSSASLQRVGEATDGQLLDPGLVGERNGSRQHAFGVESGPLLPAARFMCVGRCHEFLLDFCV